MGYDRSHAIVISSSLPELLLEANDKAVDLFGEQVSNIVKGKINGVDSFFIGPDGSKEGWKDSDNGDVLRKKYIAWLNSKAYDDKSNCLSYVEVQYGDDMNDTRIINSSDDFKIGLKRG